MLRKIENNDQSMERSIVYVASMMFRSYTLSTLANQKRALEIVHELKANYENFEQNKCEKYSIKIYLLWEEFNELYHKWVDN